MPKTKVRKEETKATAWYLLPLGDAARAREFVLANGHQRLPVLQVLGQLDLDLCGGETDLV